MRADLDPLVLRDLSAEQDKVRDALIHRHDRRISGRDNDELRAEFRVNDGTERIRVGGIRLDRQH